VDYGLPVQSWAIPEVKSIYSFTKFTGVKMEFRCRGITRGKAEGEAIVTKNLISFLGDIDPTSGKILFKESDIAGKSIVGKVFVFPGGRGSTVGTYTLLKMKKLRTAPAAIINAKTEAIIAIGAMIAEIPLVDRVEEKFFQIVKNGDRILVDADAGIVRLIKKES
jgi:hypothetical protein